MLDHFFEPFSLQHNRHLLQVIGRQLELSGGAPGPWEPRALKTVTFDAEDLAGLDARVSALLDQLPLVVRSNLGSICSMKHLHWDRTDRWFLQQPPEVRRLIQVAYDVGGEVGDITVLSQSVKDVLEDTTSSGPGRRRRLAVELREHFASILCLQGLDADADDSDLVAGLVGSRYDFATARRNDGEANTVFWDRGRWTHVLTHKDDGFVAIDLAHCGNAQPWERSQDTSTSEEPTLRVVCLRPTVRDCCAGGAPRGGLSSCTGHLPLLVCGDFGALGGAEGASLMPALATLHSAAVEATGEELIAPGGRVGEGSKLRQMWRPSAVLYRGLLLTSFLSGHTEGYLSTLSDRELENQFPAGRPPLFATFCHPG